MRWIIPTHSLKQLFAAIYSRKVSLIESMPHGSIFKIVYLFGELTVIATVDFQQVHPIGAARNCAHDVNEFSSDQQNHVFKFLLETLDLS